MPISSLIQSWIKFFIAVLMLMLTTNSWAQLGQNIPVASAKATALGNAVTADPPGIDSIHFNPAGLTRLQGSEIQLKGVLANLDAGASFQSTDRYEQMLDNFGFQDPYTNRDSEVAGLAILLPFAGVVKVDTWAGGGLGGIAYRPRGSDLTFATAVYAPMIGGLYHEDGDPGIFSGRERAITRLTYVSPSVGYQMTPTFSVGASLGVSYFGLALDMDLRFPNLILGGVGSISNAICEISPRLAPCEGALSPVEPLANINLLLEDKMSTTMNFGFLWSANSWLDVGMVYQTGAADSLKGDLTIEYKPDLANYLNGYRTAFNGTPLELVLDLISFPQNTSADVTTGTVNLEYPAHFAVGLSAQLTPRWKFNFDVKHTDTGNWNELTILLADDSELLDFVSTLLSVVGTQNVAGVKELTENSITLTRGWEDVWSYAMGAEFQATRDLVLRMGYEPRGSAIPTDFLDYIAPLGDAQLFSVGAGYRLNKLSSVDVAMGILRSKAFIPNNSSTNVNSTDIFNFIYNPYAGQDVETHLSVSIFEVSYQRRF
jgi:hypothetical protein